jgi:dethiobiotin synthetase
MEYAMTKGSSLTLVVAGTDTGVGKTVIAAALAGALDAVYWKPIQSGLDDETDSDTVRRLSGLPPERILPETYKLRMPASPHIAARLDGMEINVESLMSPLPGRGTPTAPPLVIEGAGGLLVPLTSRILQIDLYARWRFPVVLVARTALGTINHSLLSIEALRRRDIPIAGIAFSGESEPEVEMTIVEMGQVRRLGRLPHLDHLDATSLRAAFAACFDLSALGP